MLVVMTGTLERISYRWSYLDERAPRSKEFVRIGWLNAAWSVVRLLGLGFGPRFMASGAPWAAIRHPHLRVNGHALRGRFTPMPTLRPEPPFKAPESLRVLAERGDTVRAVVRAGPPGAPAMLKALVLPAQHRVQLFDVAAEGRWGHARAMARFYVGVWLTLLLLSAPLVAIFGAGDDVSFWCSFCGFGLLLAVSVALVWLLGLRACWPAAREAEAVFTALGWPAPSHIDLHRLDRGHRRQPWLTDGYVLQDFHYPPAFDSPAASP
ncbi:MAG: hypothetical protein Q4G70_09065 [Pseudomonadota bacterium]|nr:hypothetical protein [Pseudomonadota bacterium]